MGDQSSEAFKKVSVAYDVEVIRHDQHWREIDAGQHPIRGLPAGPLKMVFFSPVERRVRGG